MEIFEIVKDRLRKYFETDMVSIRMSHEQWDTVLDAIRVYENTIDDLYCGTRNETELRNLINSGAMAGMARVTINRRLHMRFGKGQL